MAGPVYDKDKDLDSLTPEAIRGLEQEYSTKQDENEDKAIEDGAGPEELERGGTGRKLRQKSEAGDAEADDDPAQKLQNQWQKAKEGDGKSLYGGRGKGNKNLLSNIRKNRKLMAGLVFGSGAIIASIFAIFSFLNVFKLDNIMSNIDASTFARLNGVQDRRSLSWMQAYMEMRMMDIGNNPDLSKGKNSDNLIFRSDKISTGNPLTDWYRTMRTSNFEQDLFEKSGIKFTSVLEPNGSGGYRVRAGSIDINGDNPITVKLGAGDVTKIQNGNIATLNKFRNDLNLKVFDNDKQARDAIKKAVQDNTRFFQVYKRRQLRKNIQNMIGVRSWTFFENKRNAFNEKKIDIRNKLIDAAIPKDTLSGKFVRCLFGIANCQFDEDPLAPPNQDAAALAGEENPDKTSRPVDGENGKPVKGTEVNLGKASDFIKNVINKVAPGLNAINLISTLDSLSRVNSALENGKLSKGITIARGIQAMGLYQVFETARDQAKSGDLTASEYSQLMLVLGSVASSEAWTKVINGHGDPGKLTNTAASKSYCSSKSQASLEANPGLANTNSAFKFAFLCPDKQIGSSSNAAALESAYKSTIGGVLGPTLSAYNSIRHNSFFGPIGDFLTGLVSKFSGLLSKLIIEPILKITGLNGDVKSAVQWMVGKLSGFLGAGPIMTGNEPGGVFMNWMMQGGAYTAEASTRAAGAALSTTQSIAQSQVALSGYRQSQQAQESFSQRYLSKSNPDSPVSKSLFAISQIKFSSVGSMLTNFGSVFKTIGSAIMMPFTHSALAATNNGYSAANFSGIQTYDFPAKCYDPVSLTAQAIDGTNALSVFRQYGLNVSSADQQKLESWATETNSTDFYATIYNVIDPKGTGDNDDEIAQKIYNCNLLDNTVRGSLGYVYGYTQDNGLNDGSTSSTTGSSPGTTDTGSSTGSGTLPSGTAQQLAQELLPYIKDGKIFCGSAAGGSGSADCSDIQNTATGTPLGGNCAVDALTPNLLALILGLVRDDGWKLGISAMCSDHHVEGDGPYGGHTYGSVADFSSQNGASGAAAASDEKFVDDAAALLSVNGGSFGQVQCHPAYAALADSSKFTTFNDDCSHQHIRAAP